MRSDFADRASDIRHVTVLPPDVTVYLVTAGGVVEQMDAETDSARSFVASLAAALLSEERNLEPANADRAALEHAAPDAFRETQMLFAALNASMQVHAYGPERQRLKRLRQDFDLTVGPQTSALAPPDTDALLFIRATDYRASAGRQALKFGAVAAGLLLGVVPLVQSEPTGVSMALVEPSTGNVLWFTHVRADGTSGLKTRKSTELLLRRALRRMPRS